MADEFWGGEGDTVGQEPFAVASIALDRSYTQKAARRSRGGGALRLRERYLRSPSDAASFLLVRGNGIPVKPFERLEDLYLIPSDTFLTLYVSLILDDPAFLSASAPPLLILQTVLVAAMYSLTKRQASKLLALLRSRESTLFYFNEFDLGADPGSAQKLFTRVRELLPSYSRFDLLGGMSQALAGAGNVKRVTVNEFVGRYCTADDASRLLEECTVASCAPESAGDTLASVVKQSAKVLQLHEGKLTVFRNCPSEGCIGEDPQVLVVGRALMGRAMHGDLVAVELLPREQWQAPTAQRHLSYHPPPDSEEDANEDKGMDAPHLSISSKLNQGVMPTGRVVAVIRRSRQAIVATIPPSHMSTAGYHGSSEECAVLAVPMNRRFPKIRLRTRQQDWLSGRRLVLRVDSWEQDSTYPDGHYERDLGPVGEVESELRAVMMNDGAITRPFSPAALACLPAPPQPGAESSPTAPRLQFGVQPAWHDSCWKPSPKDLEGRLDLRDGNTWRIISVDPPGCQDIDDALHIRRLQGERGKVVFELGIHIADVSHFVQHGSALDMEARMRGTTVYLPHRRFDMLPSLLSSDICSLHAHRDRLAMSCILKVELDADGEPVLPLLPDGSLDCWFGRTVIRSVASMTYSQADSLLRGLDGQASDPPPPPGQAGGPLLMSECERKAVTEDLKLMERIAQARRRWREAQGALNLSGGSELKFKLNSETGMPLTVAGKAPLEIHRTIEELMILANQAAAETTLRAFPSVALVRSHATAPKGLDELSALLAAAGCCKNNISEDSGAAIQAAVQSAGHGPAGALARSVAARSMAEAQYACSGSLPQNEKSQGGRFHHFGLAIPSYTHFTSPIRRYADLVVHRLLVACAAACRTTSSPSASGTLKRGEVSEGLALPASQAPSIVALGEHHRPIGNTGSALGSVHRKLNPDGSSTFLKFSCSSSSQDRSPETAEGGDALIDALLGLDMLSSDSSAVDRNGSACGAEDRLQEQQNSVSGIPFTPAQLTQLCEDLNDRHRNAKRLSWESQQMFLRLYFAQNEEVVDAVVAELKVNGFVAYVPSFDFRGPVYLCDRNGVIQMDPALLNLPASTGGPAGTGFQALPCCRSLPGWRLELQDDADGGVLRVVGIGSSLELRVMQTVKLRVTCDVQANQARLPDIRLALLPNELSKERSGLSAGASDTAAMLGTGRDVMIEARAALPSPSPPVPGENGTGLYCRLNFLQRRAMFSTVIEERSRKHGSAPVPCDAREELVKGRCTFGGFRTVATAQSELITDDFDDGELTGTMYENGGGAGMSTWNDSDEQAARREASSRILRESAKRRHYKKAPS
jgi:exoribonuclease R